MESSNARMANLARQEMYFHEFISIDEIISRISEVDAAMCRPWRSGSLTLSASPSPCWPPGWCQDEASESGVLKCA